MSQHPAWSKVSKFGVGIKGLEPFGRAEGGGVVIPLFPKVPPIFARNPESKNPTIQLKPRSFELPFGFFGAFLP